MPKDEESTEDDQEGSRNLSDFCKIELAMAREPLEKCEQGQRSDLTSVRQRTEVEKDKQKPTRKSAAKAGVCNSKYIAEHASEQQKDYILDSPVF